MILRFKCGLHVVAFGLSQAEVVAAIVDGSMAYKESWCTIPRENVVQLIEGLQLLLTEGDRAKARPGVAAR